MIRVSITWQGAANIKGLARAMPTINRAAFVEALTFWHRHYRERHFTQSGARMYHYKGRTSAYRKRKRRLKGHGDPLVYSGASKRASQLRKVVATRKTGRVVMNMPNLNRAGRVGLDLRGEMTRVHNEEQRVMVQEIFDRAQQRGIDEFQEVERMRA